MINHSPTDKIPLETKYSWGLFIFLLISYVYFLPRWADPNQDSRLKMVVAVVEDGTFQIDKYLGTTVDYAKVNNHYYSDKAPGVAFLGIPLYAGLRLTFETNIVSHILNRLESSSAFQGTLNPEGSGVNTQKIRFALAQVVLSIFIGAIPTAILGVLIFRWLDLFKLPPTQRLILALGYGILTPAFAYANTLYGHQLSAALLFGAFFWVSVKDMIKPIGLMAIGILLAYSVITEYPTILLVGIIFLYTSYKLYRNGHTKDIVWVMSTAGPMAIAWMWYNATIFGGPLNLGYSYSELWVNQHSSGFMSLTIPHIDALWGITFGIYRGLFTLSPWLLFCIPGFFLWFRAKKFRSEWLVVLLCVLSMYFFNASSGMWWGGFAIGPRYILPALPFMILPIGFAFAKWRHRNWFRWIIAGLMIWSVFTVWGLTLSGQAFPSDTIYNPLIDYAIPNWLSHNIARNLGTLLGFKGLWSLIPLLIFWGILVYLWNRISQPRISSS